MSQPATASAGPASQRTHPSSVTRKGQATIPADICRWADIAPGDNVLFSLKNGRITLEKVITVDAAWNAGQLAMMAEWDDPAENAYND